MQELYRSLEKMRPNMFRMASNLKPEDEGMEDILQTNDDLLRVLDTYKRVVDGTKEGGTVKQNGGADVGGKTESEKPEEARAVGGSIGLAMGGEGEASTLIDLADLDFGSLPAPSMGGMTPSTADSLLDTLGTLGKNCHLYMYAFQSLHKCKSGTTLHD